MSKKLISVALRPALTSSNPCYVTIIMEMLASMGKAPGGSTFCSTGFEKVHLSRIVFGSDYNQFA